ncbi:BspA family leucine-rich repeat surface protein [Anaerovoracaceae bacterium 42-11]
MKKKIKRWLSIALTASMLLSISVSTFAAEPSSTLKQPADNGIQEDAENQEQNVPDKDPNTVIQDTAVSKGEESAEEATAEKIKKAKATVVVADDTRTVLHEDGTLIINELAENLEVNAEQHGGIIREYPAWDGDENPYSFDIDTELPWAEERDLIQRVEIGSNIQPVSTALWFSGCDQASSADFTNLDMSNVTNTSYMFEDFGAVADSVTLSFDTWRTDSLSTTVSMFEGCGRYANKVSITGLENWNMAGVKNTESMFASLGANAQEVILSTIDDWDFRSNGSMTTMFARIGGSLKIDLGKWDSPHADFSGMFAESKNLDFGSIHIPNSYVSSMFARAENIRGKVFLSSDGLTGIDFEFALNTNVTGGALYLVPENKSAHNWAMKMESQYGLSGSVSQGHVYLEAEDLASRTVLYADGTFIMNELSEDQTANEAKHGAASKEFPAWDGEENDYVFGDTGVPWFSYRYDITAVEVGSKISPVDTSKWFFECSYAATAELSKLDMSNVTSADQMFYNFGGMASGKDVVISGLETWDVGKLQNLHGMFMWVGQFASSVTITGFTNWDIRNAEDTSQMFEFVGRSAKVVNLSSFDGWNTIKIKTTAKMFYGLGDEAVSVNLSGFENWVTVNLENTESMFAECASSDKQEVVMDLSKWVIFNVTNMRNMFASFRVSAEKVTFLGLDHWKFNNNAILSGMFNMSSITGSTPSVSEYNIGTLTIPGGCIVDNMFQSAHNVKGTLKLTGKPVSEYGGDTSFAWNANTKGGALYLAPTNKEALTFAEEAVSKYGPSGSESEGNIYLLRDYLMRTVVYEDGTLIINESGKDQEANEAKHGAVKKEYPAWDGVKNDYNIDGNGVPWSWLDDIAAVEVGSKISPVNTSRWFFALNVTRMDLSLLDMSHVTKAVEMFGESTCGEIAGLENWDVSNVKDAHNMFGWFCMGATTSIELSGIENWKFPGGANLSGMFMSSGAVRFDSFTIPAACDISNMFNSSSEVYGELIINGVQTCNEEGEWNGFAKNANLGKGTLYLVPDDAAYSWAEETEAKYGPSGSVSQGHVYLRKMLDFAVTESIDMTGSANTADLTVTDLTVENLGRKEITVSSVQVNNILNGWTLAANSTDFAALAKDSKMFSLVIGEFDLSKGAYTAGGSIPTDEQKVFKLTGKTGVVSNAINKQRIANLVVTVTGAE